MLWLILGGIGLIFFLFAFNLYRSIYISLCLDAYKAYCENKNEEFLRRKPIVAKYVTDARVSPYVFTSYATVNVTLDCLNFKLYKDTYISILNDTMAIYRHRALSIINPLKWIEFIIFLPKKIINYITTSKAKESATINTITKILEVIYWIASIIIIIIQATRKG
jgi:hypothetical protein